MNRQIARIIGIVSALILACAPAIAEQQPRMPQQAYSFSAKGSIARPDAQMLLSPLGGQVEDFSWVAGDAAAAGELAFALRPTLVYAPADGVVVSLRARPGDPCQDVVNQYGALCYIEREGVWHIAASTASAYDDPDNRDVRIGSTVRLKTGSGSDEEKGEGTVIALGDKEFTVELPRGDFELEDSTRVFLSTSKNYDSRDQLGKGKIVRPEAAPVVGEGVVARALVAEGERVVRGQPLFVLDGAGARYQADQAVESELRFPENALIGEVLVSPGEFVQQGQAVMAMLPASQLMATLEVDELDIAKVQLGQKVRVYVDAYQQERTGTVEEIRGVGVTVLDTTKFDVRVRFEKTDDLMIGMHVTGYWD